ncbi:29212_t:CDS:2 [Gigaspora margarita]|uniref:29212_t:CDS:1 n=1 Tax=Gigaspora margarita TaxID=4874 RepID=A0ABN7VX69_GIGMA|nr:29212_t:CDS:2 [Gigaspora margarita]
MSTDQTPQNISCLKTLALNILKNGTPEVIAKGVEVPELDLCSRCKEELFLYELKKPFTILICGHIFHRSCLEDYVKDFPQCPECAIEIESIDYTRYSGTSEPSSQDQVQSTSDPMQISPQMAQITSDQSQNIVTSDTTYISNPTLSQPTNLKKLIDELTTENLDSAENIIITQSGSVPASESDPESVDFFSSYRQVVKAEDDSKKTIQDVIRAYYKFGQDLKKRLKYHKKNHKKQVAQILVNDEVRSQLPKEIGENKIDRIRSFNASSIFKLSQENIDYVILNVTKKSK